MDRLPAVDGLRVIAVMSFAIAAASGCSSDRTDQPLNRRVVAVAAKEGTEERLAEFCDVVGNSLANRSFSLPALDSQPTFSEGESRWINVWATWCGPCIEEIPMLVDWQTRLKTNGAEVALKLISVDEEIGELRAFEKKHPKFPTSFHLSDQEALLPWMTGLGLDKGAGLPIHIFADARGQILCVRAAAIKPAHYKTVFTLLSAENSGR